MQNAKRDDNRIPAIQGVSSLGTGAPTDIYVDPTTHEMLTQSSIKETVPTDTTKLNASYVLSYNASNQLITISKVIGGVTYSKTLTWTGDVCTAISVWT